MSSRRQMHQRSRWSGRSVEAPIVVVGAGPHALTFCAALAAVDLDAAERTTVVDPSGTWLTEWDSMFARQDIRWLRSPAVHHPGLDPYDYLGFAANHGTSSPLTYQQPCSATFSMFCRAVSGRLPVAMISAQVVSIGDGYVGLDDGRHLAASTVIVAANRRTRRHLVCEGDAIDQVVHGDDVDVSDARPGERIGVVGGGLSAAHLAGGAARRGATVEWFVRRSLRVSEFDTDPGWLGPKHLEGFRRLCSGDRRRTIDAARDGGSVPAWMLDEVLAAVASGSIVLCESTEVTSVEMASDARLALSWRSRAAAREVTGRTGRSELDRVWAAIGTTFDVTTDPLLAGPVARAGVEVHGGIPEVDATLRIPGLRAPAVHVMGAYAGLVLGPSARNLAGARSAARAILGPLCAANDALALMP